MYNDAYEHEAGRTLGAVVVGVACGAVVGATIALLITPRSGRELRGHMSDSVNRLRDRAKDTYTRAADAVTGVVSQASIVAEGVSGRAADLTSRLHNALSTSTARPS